MSFVRFARLEHVALWGSRDEAIICILNDHHRAQSTYVHIRPNTSIRAHAHAPVGVYVINDDFTLSLSFSFARTFCLFKFSFSTNIHSFSLFVFLFFIFDAVVFHFEHKHVIGQLWFCCDFFYSTLPITMQFHLKFLLVPFWKMYFVNWFYTISIAKQNSSTRLFAHCALFALSCVAYLLLFSLVRFPRNRMRWRIQTHNKTHTTQNANNINRIPKITKCTNKTNQRKIVLSASDKQMQFQSHKFLKQSTRANLLFHFPNNSETKKNWELYQLDFFHFISLSLFLVWKPGKNKNSRIISANVIIFYIYYCQSICFIYIVIFVTIIILFVDGIICQNDRRKKSIWSYTVLKANICTCLNGIDKMLPFKNLCHSALFNSNFLFCVHTWHTHTHTSALLRIFWQTKKRPIPIGTAALRTNGFRL